MKLDTEHYTLHDNGTVTDKDGRVYMAPSPYHYAFAHVILYAGGGVGFDTVHVLDHDRINAAFARRGIRPPYVP